MPRPETDGLNEDGLNTPKGSAIVETLLVLLILGIVALGWRPSSEDLYQLLERFGSICEGIVRFLLSGDPES